MNNIIAIITELGELEERTRELMGQFDYGIAADYRVASDLSQELNTPRGIISSVRCKSRRRR